MNEDSYLLLPSTGMPHQAHLKPEPLRWSVFDPLLFACIIGLLLNQILGGKAKQKN